MSSTVAGSFIRALLAFSNVRAHPTETVRRSLLGLVLAAALAGCAGADEPGDPAVYDRIAGLTDCAALQVEFDRAMGNHERAQAGTDERRWTLAYAQAADDQMKKVGCYG